MSKAQSAFTRRIWYVVLQLDASRRGEAKARLKALARLSATLMRSRDNKKSMPLGVSSAEVEVIDTRATAAS